jgi:lipoprotein NlpI
MRVALVAAVIASLGTTPTFQRATERPGAMLDQAIDDFLAGRVAESVAGFDRVVAVAPDAAPQLWQRGIALYYVGRYDDCRRQFESHRTVNPDDVENPAWHFLCVARAESPQKARAALLPVGPDQRRPMREIYRMFQGVLPPAAVLTAAGSDASAQFFAALYVGLYYDALGKTAEARTHLAAAASERFAAVGGYMHRVATLHPLLTGRRR